jgi:hypothetical protein
MIAPVMYINRSKLRDFEESGFNLVLFVAKSCERMYYGFFFVALSKVSK